MQGDLISREAVLDILEKEGHKWGNDYRDWVDAVNEVETLPSVKQEPCEKVAQERYADLCEYFGGTKDILKSRKNFKAWLERVKWHVRKAEELYEKYEYKKELCTDAVSRQAVLDEINSIGVKGFETYNDYSQLYDFVDTLSSVNPQEPSITWVTGSDGAKIAFKDVPVWKVIKICQILADVVEAEEEQETKTDTLDKIRAEIEKLADADGYGDYQLGFSFGLMMAMEIIDKYKAESDNCN